MPNAFARLRAVLPCALLILLAVPMTASASVVHGTKKSDRLVGTTGADTIRAKAGSDKIDGRGGADRIFAGAG